MLIGIRARRKFFAPPYAPPIKLISGDIQGNQGEMNNYKFQ